MLLTRDDYIECVRLSGLIDEERLRRFVEDFSEEQDVLELGRALVEVGYLTDWQRERLLEKKWRGFFIGKYKILSPLGAGGMGSVFLAEHKVMRQRVALKVLAKRLAARPSNVARFEREARAAAVVNHPNVVRAYDIDCEGDTHYLVMEYVQGENLQKMVHTSGPLDPLLAANYTAQIARGLHESHRNGMIHRDIKPSNVLLDNAGVVKILDLGLARIDDDESNGLTIAHDTKMIGTVDYLAPEQAINSHAIDGRADIYSLGCSLYYLLTGVPPFPNGSLTERILKHQSRRPLDIRKRRPGVPDALVHICSRMMEKQPARRYQTAGEAADALQAFCDGTLNETFLDDSNRTAEDSGSGIYAYSEDSSATRSLPGGNNSIAKSDLAFTSPSSRSQPGTSRNANQSSVSQAVVSKSQIPPRSANDNSRIASGSGALSASALEKTISHPTSSSTFEEELELTPVELSPATKTPATQKTVAKEPKPESPAKHLVAPEISIGSLEPDQANLLTAIDPLGATEPLGFSSPLAVSADPLQATPSLLDTIPLNTPSSTASAETASLTPTNVLLANALKSVAAETEEGINYSLWFLIASGLIISIILGVVGFSYVNSFSKEDLNKNSLESKY